MDPDTMTYIRGTYADVRVDLCGRTCGPMRTYVSAYADVRIGSCVYTCELYWPMPFRDNRTGHLLKKQMRLNKRLSSRTVETNSFISICLIS